MTGPIILSHIQAAAMLEARDHGRPSLATTLDLGMSQVEIALEGRGITLDGTLVLDWDALRTIV
ncbi:MAG TPA: hypothetical protein VNL71_25770, partial [Chloroflexota bacterium]|nr:hypothetical protein [Chloroflexota bacterium]